MVGSGRNRTRSIKVSTREDGIVRNSRSRKRYGAFEVVCQDEGLGG
jgi:hypothetical protein